MSNRGIGRARYFMGGLLLFAAVITWSTGFMMSPHGDPSVPGAEQVRRTVALFMRNTAIGTLILCAISAWLLFPARRPKWPARDWALLGLLGLLVGTSVYNLIWLQTAVLS